MNDYRFTVLMSVYKNEKADYFTLALESILVNQELKPDEFVLVVDGPVSTELDNIILDYHNRFKEILKIYRLDKNVGLGRALNYGIEKCSYNLIARADSDDINAPNRFKELIDTFRENEELDIIGSCIDEFESDPKIITNIKRMPITHEEIVKMSKFRNPINHMSVMFKKEAVLKAGGYKHLYYLEDYFLWIRAINKGVRIKNIDKKLVHVRVGDGMLARRSNRNYINSWRKLNIFMLKNRMINIFEYMRNMFSIRIFIYIPVSLKAVIYRKFLRN